MLFIELCVRDTCLPADRVAKILFYLVIVNSIKRPACRQAGCSDSPAGFGLFSRNLQRPNLTLNLKNAISEMKIVILAFLWPQEL